MLLFHDFYNLTISVDQVVWEIDNNSEKSM